MDKLPRLREDQLDLVNAALDKLKAVNAESLREGTFLKSLQDQFSRGKGLTPKQRDWLLKIVSREEPDRDFVSRIQAILSSVNPTEKCGTLETLLVKVVTGKFVSPTDEKIVSACELALSQGEVLPLEMFTESMDKNMKLAAKVARGMGRLHGIYDGVIVSIFDQFSRKGFVSSKQYKLVMSSLSSLLDGLIDSPLVSGTMISVPPGTHFGRISSTSRSDVYLSEETSNFTICLVTGCPDYSATTGKFVPVLFEDGTFCLLKLSPYITIIS